MQLLKRSLDFSVALIGLVFLSPLLFVIALAVKLTSPGFIFYRWKIIGKDGKRITSYKFRSMVENAEAIEKELRDRGINEMESVYFKLRDDFRVTPVGKILRRFSLDEIPQLFSVLKGDMSLVGPRPVRQSEYKELAQWHKARFSVKPGGTSLWVVEGKNEIRNFDDIVKGDLHYIEHWSIWLDLKILLKTVPVIILGRNT